MANIFDETLIKEGLEANMQVLRNLAELEPEAAQDIWGAAYTAIQLLSATSEGVRLARESAQSEGVTLREFLDNKAKEMLRSSFPSFEPSQNRDIDTPSPLPGPGDFDVDEFVKRVFGHGNK